MQSLLFNLTFQMVFTINNSKNIPPVLLLYSVNPGILLDEEQLYVAQFTQGIINWNHRLISEQWNKDISIPRGWSHTKNVVILVLPYIQSLYLIFSEVSWVLVPSGTHVRPQIILQAYVNQIQVLSIFVDVIISHK